jgi:hypothetical protein
MSVSRRMVLYGPGCRKGEDGPIMNTPAVPLPPSEAKAQMHHRKLAVAALTGLGFLACGRGEPDTLPPHQLAEATAATPTAEPAAASTADAVLTPASETTEKSGEDQATPGIAAELVGNWELRSEPPQRMPGLHMTVTVDSTSGTRYFGRLSNYFSGDVGIDPREFEPFVDSIGSDRTVTFVMPTMDGQLSGIEMEGSLLPDTVRLNKFVLGPDTLSNLARQWVLVRSR